MSLTKLSVVVVREYRHRIEKDECLYYFKSHSKARSFAESLINKSYEKVIYPDYPEWVCWELYHLSLTDNRKRTLQRQICLGKQPFSE